MAEAVTADIVADYVQGSEEHYKFLVEVLNVPPFLARQCVDIEAGRRHGCIDEPHKPPPRD